MDLNSNNANASVDLPNSTSDFAKTVEESKIQLQNEAMKPVAPKRGRGRPPKADSSARPSMAGQTRPQASQVVAPSMAPTQPPPDVSKHLVPIIKSLSKIPATNTGIQELEFTMDEAIMCAEALNNVAQAFFPDLNNLSPKAAALLGAGLVFSTVGYQKMLIYAEKKAPKSKPVKKGAEPTEKTDNSERPSELNRINPIDYLNQ